MSTAILYNQIQSLVNNVNFLSSKINDIEKNKNETTVPSITSIPSVTDAQADKLIKDKIEFLTNEYKCLSTEFKTLLNDVKALSNDTKMLSNEFKKLSSQSSNEQNIMTKVEQLVTKCTKERIELNNVNTMLQISSLQKQLDEINVAPAVAVADKTDKEPVDSAIQGTDSYDTDLKKKRKPYSKKVDNKQTTEITIE